MKSTFHKSIAVFMAGVVLFTTVSFAVDFHYCGDTLVDFSFIQKADTCGMEKITSAPSCENPSVKEKSCCKDQQLVKQGQEDLKVSLDQLSLEQQIFVASFAYSYISLFEITHSTKPTLKAFPPPLIVRHIYKLDETYLI